MTKKKVSLPTVSKTTWSSPVMGDSGDWVDATTAFGDTVKTYLYKITATTSSTPVHSFKPSTTASGGTITGVYGSSATWTLVGSEQAERDAIWARLREIKSGHGNLGLDQIVKLVELQTMHGETMGLVRFVLDERDGS